MSDIEFLIDEAYADAAMKWALGKGDMSPYEKLLLVILTFKWVTAESITLTRLQLSRATSMCEDSITKSSAGLVKRKLIMKTGGVGKPCTYQPLFCIDDIGK